MNQALIDRAIGGGATVTYGKDHAVYSINPPQTLFGYTYFSHIIPPFKPDSCLILGYGSGTVGKLIHKIWGEEVKITGVDLVAHDVGVLDANTFLVKLDALKYVQSASLGLLKKRFDYVVVDVWEGYEVPTWIFHKTFPKMLAQITKKLLCLNVPRDTAEMTDMYLQYGFNYDRNDVIDKNCVLFYSKVNKDNE